MTQAAKEAAPGGPELDFEPDGKPRSLQRFPRFQSHALIDVRTHWWNPFKVASAVLLDLSVQGFKVEFVNPVKLRAGQRVFVSIPLSPFHILSPSRLKLSVELKWFDAQSLRAGGVFESLHDVERHIVEKVIHRISEGTVD